MYFLLHQIPSLEFLTAKQSFIELRQKSILAGNVFVSIDVVFSHKNTET